MMSRPVKVFALLLMVVALAGASWIGADANQRYLRSKAPVDLDIEPGTSSTRIAGLLEDTGVIRSRHTFLVLHYLRRKQTLKAGYYSFDHPISPREVFRVLVLGEVARQELTIPEGLNRFDIASLVAQGGIATREEFLKASSDTSIIADLDPSAPSLEGYLFPDTYAFPRHGGAWPIVRAMVGRFRQVYASLATADENAPIREVVMIASMVETETGNANERPMVASVFYNRLQRGIPLQCDPTVIYAAILQNSYSGNIGSAELNSTSPFNTYMHSGLPPGPIANPGKASLLAALHPASTKYLYFVVNSTGHHTFSRTLAEHNLAVSLYRRGLPR
jgi:peptidoglycan lytic transglycosylase G